MPISRTNVLSGALTLALLVISAAGCDT